MWHVWCECGFFKDALYRLRKFPSVLGGCVFLSWRNVEFYHMLFLHLFWWSCSFVLILLISSVQFSSVVSCVRLSATPWIAARQASLSITNFQSSLRLRSIESVLPSNHLILCHPLLLLPAIPPSIRVFSIESTLRMRWPKYWSSILLIWFINWFLNVKPTLHFLCQSHWVQAHTACHMIG